VLTNPAVFALSQVALILRSVTNGLVKGHGFEIEQHVFGNEPPCSALDDSGALAGGEPAIAKIVMVTHTGMTTADFSQIVGNWIAAAKHPVTGRIYTEMVYQLASPGEPAPSKHRLVG
jgi:hypothetical protein